MTQWIKASEQLPDVEYKVGEDIFIWVWNSLHYGWLSADNITFYVKPFEMFPNHAHDHIAVTDKDNGPIYWMPILKGPTL